MHGYVMSVSYVCIHAWRNYHVRIITFTYTYKSAATPTPLPPQSIMLPATQPWFRYMMLTIFHVQNLEGDNMDGVEDYVDDDKRTSARAHAASRSDLEKRGRQVVMIMERKYSS